MASSGAGLSLINLTNSRRNFLTTLAVLACVLFLFFVPPQGMPLDDNNEHGHLAHVDDDTAVDQGHPPRDLLQAGGHDNKHHEHDHELKSGHHRQQQQHEVVDNSPSTASEPAPVVLTEEQRETREKLQRRGWQSELELERALDILRRADELLTSPEASAHAGDRGAYFLTYGSLLGYCRHADSFTPWDDDMDVTTPRAVVEWLASPQGQKAAAAHGLEVKRLGSETLRYIKLFLPGVDVPRAGDCPWGYPFLDVFPFDVNATTGLLELDGDDPLPPSVYLPPRRVGFHPRLPRGLLVPREPGHLLDSLFPGWRGHCRMTGYNHRLEDGDDSLEGDCAELVGLLGAHLAPPERCPSASMPIPRL